MPQKEEKKLCRSNTWLDRMAEATVPDSAGLILRPLTSVPTTRRRRAGRRGVCWSELEPTERKSALSPLKLNVVSCTHSICRFNLPQVMRSNFHHSPRVKHRPAHAVGSVNEENADPSNDCNRWMAVGGSMLMLLGLCMLLAERFHSRAPMLDTFNAAARLWERQRSTWAVQTLGVSLNARKEVVPLRAVDTESDMALDTASDLVHYRPLHWIGPHFFRLPMPSHLDLRSQPDVEIHVHHSLPRRSFIMCVW
jgi:hypothetical protein